jgi:hypothetical protein
MSSNVQKDFEEKAFGKPTLVPRFFEHARINTIKTAAYGIKVYDTFTYIEIKTSGRKDTTTRKATDEDKMVFAESYAKYQSHHQFNTIPMEALAGFSIANQFILRDLGVHTVEDLNEYSGSLPLASLKMMNECAAFMVEAMSDFSPPTFHDDHIQEVPRETIQTQRQVLQTSESLGATDGQERDNGSGVQRLGVTLNEEGEVTEIHGQALKFKEEGVQKEIHQEVVNFY